jgi:hypothetical protein
MALEEVVHLRTGSRRAPQQFNGVLELMAQRFDESIATPSSSNLNEEQSMWARNLQMHQQACGCAVTGATAYPHHSIGSPDSLDQTPKRLGPFSGASNRSGDIGIIGSDPRQRGGDILAIDSFAPGGPEHWCSAAQDGDDRHTDDISPCCHCLPLPPPVRRRQRRAKTCTSARLPRPRDFPANCESCFHSVTRLEAISNPINAGTVFEEVVHLCGASRRAPQHFQNVLELMAQ